MTAGRSPAEVQPYSHQACRTRAPRLSIVTSFLNVGQRTFRQLPRDVRRYQTPAERRQSRSAVAPELPAICCARRRFPRSLDSACRRAAPAMTRIITQPVNHEDIHEALHCSFRLKPEAYFRDLRSSWFCFSSNNPRLFSRSLRTSSFAASAGEPPMTCVCLGLLGSVQADDRLQGATLATIPAAFLISFFFAAMMPLSVA